MVIGQSGRGTLLPLPASVFMKICSFRLYIAVPNDGATGTLIFLYKENKDEIN